MDFLEDMDDPCSLFLHLLFDVCVAVDITNILGQLNITDDFLCGRIYFSKCYFVCLMLNCSKLRNWRVELL